MPKVAWYRGVIFHYGEQTPVISCFSPIRWPMPHDSWLFVPLTEDCLKAKKGTYLIRHYSIAF